jgi:hypothetical protein
MISFDGQIPCEYPKISTLSVSMPRRQYQIVFLLSLCAIPSCVNYFSARYVGTDAYCKIGANITSLAFSSCRYNGNMNYEWYCVGGRR